MSRIQGITVVLYEEGESSVNPFGEVVYTETATEVENVLVMPTSSAEAVTEQNIYGTTSVYTLAIPKGDTHDWSGKKVEFFGQTFKTFDMPVQSIDELTPLDWNLKVKVQRYG